MNCNDVTELFSFFFPSKLISRIFFQVMIAVCDCGTLKQKPVFKKSQPIVRNSMKVYLTWPFTPQDLILQAQEQTPWPKFLFEKKGGATWCQPNKLILFLEKRVCERKKSEEKLEENFLFVKST